MQNTSFDNILDVIILIRFDTYSFQELSGF